ncbi:MAG: DUF885 family protein [Saprospiraceae bacterium]|nr:DUF885 family protein [Saprospiraceae bacterium]
MKNIILLNSFIFCLFYHFSYSQNSIPDLIIQYNADQQILQRFYTVQGASETSERMQQLIVDYRSQLEKLNYDRLTLGEKVDYQLFLRNLNENYRLEKQLQNELKAAESLFPFANDIYTLIVAKRRGQQPDAQAVAEQMAAVQVQIATLSQTIEAGPNINAELVRPTLAYLESLKKALLEAHRFYDDYDPVYSWWTKKPFEDLNKAMEAYAKLLDKKQEVQSNQKRDKSGIVGVPIGDAEIRKQLQYEMIPYTPDELIQIAEQEFAWCDREMLKASRAMGFGDNWHKALEAVKEKYVAPGQQPAVIDRLYNESIDFIKKRDLITIPPLAEETWRMSMMSAERQRVSPFFLGGEQIIISYPTSTMTHEEKLMSMRGNNPHFSRATVQHELIPGHGLQAFMSRRYNTYRDFNTPFWGEGWALYWERLLWDLGFPETPEDKIGMLFWRMHRCARIIFSLKYHQGEWTPQECIDFLVERVGHERANAEGEVRRSFTGNYGPLYQLAYMIGGLQFEALKKELVDSGKMSYRAFHDQILQENRMPVEMVRALLTKKAPSKDFKTSWRFYELKP